jgi:hypothetical protein
VTGKKSFRTLLGLAFRSSALLFRSASLGLRTLSFFAPTLICLFLKTAVFETLGLSALTDSLELVLNPTIDLVDRLLAQAPVDERRPNALELLM